MCLQPFSIKNPNYGLSKVGLNYLKDCDSQYISIPCGHCPECIAVRQMYLVQRVQMESMKNYIFFVTLTYDNKHLPVVTTSTGFDIRYFDIRDLQLLFKDLRNHHSFPRPFRYFAVSELGSKKGRPHAHILFFVPKFKVDGPEVPENFEKCIYDAVKLSWRKNVGTRKHPVYEPRFTHVSRWIGGQLKSNYDCHLVRPNRTLDYSSSVAFYCLKYMLKPSDRAVRLQQALRLNLSDDEYNDIWKLVKPRYICSKGFGLNGTRVGHTLFFDNDLLKVLHDNIDSSDKTLGYPLYRNPATGQSFPLAPYFRRNSSIFTLSQAHDLYFNKVERPELDPLNFSAKKKFYDYEKMLSVVDCHDSSDLFDELL